MPPDRFLASARIKILLLPFGLPTLIFSTVTLVVEFPVSKLWFSMELCRLPFEGQHQRGGNSRKMIWGTGQHSSRGIGATDTCSGLEGPEKATCNLQHVRSAMSHGKLKFL
ncbi:hypothetical protein V6N12_029568 [Hibiscus sabdariffa]|uniref:Uncharacterized protein n=1 Tax=Hibiscus sabdariffa TaxID=183260 RepID=A0ABR2CWI7_9ROSI